MKVEHYGKILLGLIITETLNKVPIKFRNGGKAISSLNKEYRLFSPSHPFVPYYSFLGSAGVLILPLFCLGKWASIWKNHTWMESPGGLVSNEL